MVLSNSLSAAINAKVAAQQNVIAQQFGVQSAERIAEITRINAKAQSDAQLIVACGGTSRTVEQDGAQVQIVTPNPTGVCQSANLTSNELTYQYIQAIRDLINSKNNVTVLLNPNGSIPITHPGRLELDHDRQVATRPPGCGRRSGQKSSMAATSSSRDVVAVQVGVDHLVAGSLEPHLALRRARRTARPGHLMRPRPWLMIITVQSRPHRSTKLVDAALLEPGVTGRERLVDEQDVGVEVRRHGEAQAGVHARRVGAHRVVERGPEVGEGHHLVVVVHDLVGLQAGGQAAEQDVLASGELAG